jgi:hypothetical protein
MKALSQIRSNLIEATIDIEQLKADKIEADKLGITPAQVRLRREAAKDMEAHFQAPTAAQQSVLSKSQLKDEGTIPLKITKAWLKPNAQVKMDGKKYTIDSILANGRVLLKGKDGPMEVSANDLSPINEAATDEKKFKSGDRVWVKVDRANKPTMHYAGRITDIDGDAAFVQYQRKDPVTGHTTWVNAIRKLSELEATPVKEDLNLEKDPVEKWIADYTKSADDRFKGKSKSDRIKMALSDYHAATKATGKKPMGESHEIEEISITRLELDEIADMADDLYYVLPNFQECPAWVQHKIAGLHASIHSIYDYYRRKKMEGEQAAVATCDPGSEPDAVRIALTSPANPVATPLPVPPAPAS